MAEQLPYMQWCVGSSPTTSTGFCWDMVRFYMMWQDRFGHDMTEFEVVRSGRLSQDCGNIT